MLEQYRTIYEGGQGEITEKKSRFIATVRLVKTEEEAVKFIEEMKKKYWDATHNCSAYVIGERREIMRCSDDGEPQGTAGKPMLDVLLGEELYNTAVVVTRYFGGTLLGTGGLVRAYSKICTGRAGTKQNNYEVSRCTYRSGNRLQWSGKASISVCSKGNSNYEFAV